jgi:hypothetical protein
LTVLELAPPTLHAPPLVKVTGFPLAPPVAFTVKVLLNAADGGGAAVKVIV